MASSSEDLSNLLGMGFQKERAEIAVKQPGGLQGALEWLEKTQDTPFDEILAASKDSSADHDAETDAIEGGVAKSLVCNECGKKFRNTAQAEFHASKTEHTDFAESTEEIAPLTDEEKKAKLDELREKLKEKREGLSEQDKIDKKKNEVGISNLHDHTRSSLKHKQEIRRKSTKETHDIKEELQKKEQLKEAAAKRKEKLADIAAKEKIKQQIQQDKEDRRLKAEREKAERAGKAPPEPVAPSVPVTTGVVTSKPASAYTETRLRLQTPGGNVQKSFSVDTTLFEVAEALRMESGVEVQSFTQNFPKKIFDSIDFGSTLKELGLVPSAALIVK